MFKNFRKVIIKTMEDFAKANAFNRYGQIV